MKFILREERRGNRYDIILAGSAEIRSWSEWRGLPPVRTIAADAGCMPRNSVAKAIGLVLTAYSIRASFYSIHELMRETMRGAGGAVESGELVIREAGAGWQKRPLASFLRLCSAAGYAQ